VVDTSPDPAACDATRSALRALARQTESEIHHADREDKHRWAGRLAKVAGLDPELVRFAVCDAHGIGHDTGANRNALLLSQGRQPFLSADDDVICELRRPGAGPASLILSGRSDATQVQLFPDRSTAFEAYQVTDDCVLDVHESLLGHSVGAFAAEHPERLQLDAVTSTSMEAWLKPGAHVAVTMTGIVGDSGAKYPAFYLWRDAGVRQQLAGGSAEEYRKLAASREVGRFVSGPTISNGAFLMTTSCAFDARRLLPPFFPVLRGQDLNFGNLLRMCFDEAFIGHLPRMIAHVPVDGRGPLGPLYPDADGPSLSVVVRQCLAIVGGAARVAASGERRLRLIGRLLQELALLPSRDFEHLVREQLWQASSRRIVALQGELRRCKHAPTHWARDLEGYIERRIAALESCAGVMPNDLAGAPAALLPELIRAFGSLLEAWPVLVASAAALEAAGEGLTRRL
jgi:hypothetical protein